MSATMMDVLLQSVLSGTGGQAMSKKVGADQHTMSRAVSVALPILISALARNASKEKGARDLHDALARDHDGGLLEGLDDFLAGGQTSEGDAILGHVLGKKRGSVEQAVGKQAGLDPKLVSQVLAMLAPLVLAYLGRQQRQQKMTPTDLGGYLDGERGRAESGAAQQIPDLGSILGAGAGQGANEPMLRAGLDLLGRLLGGGRR